MSPWSSLWAYCISSWWCEWAILMFNAALGIMLSDLAGRKGMISLLPPHGGTLGTIVA